ncbi:MAG: hypothetical protein J6V36_00625, partial [Clostridia bacterium]|nr:hypothetical protein [Clostridia bacterium]
NDESKAESQAESKAEQSAAESKADESKTEESAAESKADESVAESEADESETEESTAESEAESEEESEGEKINGLPAEEFVQWGDYLLHKASGDFGVNALNQIESTADQSIAVVVDETFKTGKISAKFVANGGTAVDNDNGIIFGLAPATDEDSNYFWEGGRSYYFLFVSDACELYLAKVSHNGIGWNEIKKVSLLEQGITYYHGSEITITAEVLEGGVIKCYADDKLIIEYTDSDPLTGEGYGLRGEWSGVAWDSLTVEKN